MPLTTRDYMSFLTPFTPGVEWAQQNARSLSDLSRQRETVLERQARAAQLAAAQANQDREYNLREQEHADAIARQQAVDARERSEKGLAAFREYGQLLSQGKHAEALALKPVLQGYGVGFLEDYEPEQAAPAPAAGPLPPPGQTFGAPDAQAMMRRAPELLPGNIGARPPNPYGPLQEFHRAAPTVAVMPLEPPLSAPAPPPEAPAAPPQRRLRGYQVTQDGKPIGYIDPDEIAQTAQRQIQAPLDALLQNSPESERPRVIASIEAVRRTYPGGPADALKMATGIADKGLGRDSAERAAIARNAATTATAQRSAERDRKNDEARRRNYEARLRGMASKTFQDQAVTVHKVPKQFEGLNAIEAGLSALDDPNASSADTASVLYSVAKIRDPSGIVTNRDVELAGGLRSIIEQGEDYLAKNLEGQYSESFRENLRNLLTRSYKVNDDLSVRTYRSLRGLRDRQPSAAEWNQFDALLESTFGHRKWYATERGKDQEYQRRLRNGEYMRFDPQPPPVDDEDVMGPPATPGAREALPPAPSPALEKLRAGRKGGAK